MSEAGITYDVFLSYNWREHAAVEAIARALRDRGLRVFLDRWYLVPGRPWPQALEGTLDTCCAVAVFLGPQGMGPWQQREKDLALDRQARTPTFSVIPVLLPGADPALGFLSLNTWVDLRAGLDDPSLLAVLTAAVRGEPPGPDLQERLTATLAAVCPYRGLRPFREEDAPFFFGREAFTTRLAEAAEQHTLVAVVGASGSGKSSVVRAGLVPHLRCGDSGHVWDIATLVPGERPLHALAAALLPLLEPEMTETDRLVEVGKLASYLAEGHVALRDVVARTLDKQPGTDRLLLVVDQWEELYTLSREEQTRRRFLDEVLEATAAGSLSVVLTLRGDFFGHALGYRPLTDRLQNAVVNLGPMTREELERAVEAPVHKVGLTFEPRLVERILDNVGEEPGNLPLLEFALTELWEERHGGQLLHAAYEAMGAVQGAIARRAEEVFARLTPLEQEAAQRVFLQLVRPGEQTEDTRRRATFAEVGEAVRPVVQQLADARLVVTGHDQAANEETIEVAHEALIRTWSRLRGWLDADREFLLWRQRLRTDLADWERTGRDEGTLLRGAPLVEAQRWLAERPDDLSPAERSFIQESLALREREREARERNRRRLNRAAVGAAMVFMILTGLAGWQWWRADKQRQLAETQRQAAEQQRQIALARQLAAQAKAITSRNLDLLQRKILLATTSLRLAYTPEARQILYEDLSTLPGWGTHITHQRAVGAVGFSPDSRYVATGSDDNTAQVWDLSSKQVLFTITHQGVVRTVSFSPDSRYVAIGSGDNTAQVSDWHVRDPLAESCVHLTRNLTTQEWQQYASGEPYRFACPNLPGPKESGKLVLR
jgi:hypothetical protein